MQKFHSAGAHKHKMNRIHLLLRKIQTRQFSSVAPRTITFTDYHHTQGLKPKSVLMPNPVNLDPLSRFRFLSTTISIYHAEVVLSGLNRHPNSFASKLMKAGRCYLWWKRIQDAASSPKATFEDLMLSEVLSNGPFVRDSACALFIFHRHFLVHGPEAAKKLSLALWGPNALVTRYYAEDLTDMLFQRFPALFEYAYAEIELPSEVAQYRNL